MPWAEYQPASRADGLPAGEQDAGCPAPHCQVTEATVEPASEVTVSVSHRATVRATRTPIRRRRSATTAARRPAWPTTAERPTIASPAGQDGVFGRPFGHRQAAQPGPPAGATHTTATTVFWPEARSVVQPPCSADSKVAATSSSLRAAGLRAQVPGIT
jgi:hypothetical protein